MKRIKKLICLFLIICIFISAFSTTVVAQDPYLYESEGNNSHDTADITYDNYDSFGTIGYSNDVDWWTFSFQVGGYVNFWLGDIPSGQDYDMYIYRFEQNTLTCVGQKITSGNTSEYIQLTVKSGAQYCVKIQSKNYGYSSSYYLFRVKRVSNLGTAHFFSYDLDSTTDTRTAAAQTLPHLWSMGYSAMEYYNNTAEALNSILPETNLLIYDGHGVRGGLKCHNNTYLYAQYTHSNYKPHYGLSEYANGALSNIKLAVFCGCETGATLSMDNSNLVDMALQKGVKCAIGWNQSIGSNRTDEWIPLFFNFCHQGFTIAESISKTHTEIIRSGISETNPIFDIYYGNSNRYFCIDGKEGTI